LWHSLTRQNSRELWLTLNKPVLMSWYPTPKNVCNSPLLLAPDWRTVYRCVLCYIRRWRYTGGKIRVTKYHYGITKYMTGVCDTPQDKRRVKTYCQSRFLTFSILLEDSCFESRQGQDIFLLYESFKTALGLIKPTIHPILSRGWSGRSVKLSSNVRPVRG
jgi:hypothetical protein